MRAARCDTAVCACAQFIYGYGVGGEYPLASSSAAERAEANKALRFRRGEMIVCTFAMQVGSAELVKVYLRRG